MALSRDSRLCAGDSYGDGESPPGPGGSVTINAAGTITQSGANPGPWITAGSSDAMRTVTLTESARLLSFLCATAAVEPGAASTPRLNTYATDSKMIKPQLEAYDKKTFDDAT